MEAKGYCHFNEDGNNRSFNINLFEMNLDIKQDPGSRDLGHGAVVWDAAVVLSKYMEKNYKDYDHKTLAKKTVLELGSGCGLGGIAFMMKGAEVTCTDLAQVTERLTDENVNAVYRKLKASLQGSISAQTIQPTIYPIDWTHNPICCTTKSGVVEDSVQIASNTMSNMSINEESSSKEAPPSSAEASCPSSSFAALMSKAPYDYVLLTDCVFSAKLAIPLVNTIRCCCGPRTTVLCCHEIRDEDANAAFLEAFSQHFTLKRVPPSKLHEQYRNDLIELIIAKPTRAKKSASATTADK